MKSAQLAVEVARALPVDLPPPAERRRRRQSAGLSEAVMGELVGVAGVSIARYELGQREPRSEIRRRYAEVLELLKDRLD